MGKKKILFLETSVFNGHPQGGSFLQAKYYSHFLKKEGYETELFAGDPRQIFWKRVKRVISKVRENDFIVGFGTPLLCFYLQWLCFLTGKRGVFCLDTIITPSDMIRDHFKRKIYNWQVIVFNLQRILYDEIIINFLPFRLNLINITSCKYVFEKLKDSDLKPLQNVFLYPKVAPQKSHKCGNMNTVLYYGALFRGRGVIDLIKACNLLWQKGYNFRLCILGHPAYPLTKKFVLNEVRKHKEKIYLYDKVNCPKDFVKKSNVVVLPFRYACSVQPPFTLLEPMAIGVPVITTDVGSHGEWVKDKQTGLFCEIENPQDIANKIEMIFKDKALKNKIIDNAKKLVSQRYKEKDLLLEILNSLKT